MLRYLTILFEHSMSLYLRELSEYDGEDVFFMLKDIEKEEHSFTNPVHDMTYSEFKRWLAQQKKWGIGEDLPKGYVKQKTYWLIDGLCPVGMGKIRYELTAQSRKSGGNIGYAIAKKYRGKGYGKQFFSLLLCEARANNLQLILATVDKDNLASRRIIEQAGGVLKKRDTERLFYWFY